VLVLRSVSHFALVFAISAGAFAAPLALASATERTKAEPEWSQLAWPPHRANVLSWRQNVEQVDQLLAGVALDDRRDLPTAKNLLKGPWLQPNEDALLGNWRCRSLQATSLGLYVNPDFKCTIARRDGQLAFAKISGSQRRTGVLYRDPDHGFVFLGGATVNDDPTVTYSALAQPVASPNPLDNDTYGWLKQRSRNHVVMLFNTDGSSYEIYELRR
jgi:Domain of unknown function (DUF4893)